MRTTAPLSEERAELEAVLNSGIFTRSPSLAQFLSYVCQRYFDGEADKIKEYNVAVEALGRPADFDQKKDSIVRVEAHRLRKRLQDYYKEEGAGHSVKIWIPPGNYVPQFQRITELSTAEAAGTDSPRFDVAPTTSLELVVPEPETALNPLIVRPRRIWPQVAALIAVLLVVGAFWLARSRRETVVPAPVARAIAPTEGDEVRIVAGSTATKVLDRYGNAWGADRYFEGGWIATSPPRPIARSEDAALYTTRREGDFSYHIPLKKGTYELRLYFAETVFGENNMLGGGETSRVFNVTMNGKPLLTNFDIIGDAPGSNAADIRVFKDVTPGPDGKLHLRFQPIDKVALVNAIEVLPANSGYMRPVRLIAGTSSFTDSNNRVWSSDRYYQGGIFMRRHSPILNTKDDLLYQSERFGNFVYSIPVPAGGRYTVTMRFCENWFGAPGMGAGGAGDRVFDVYLGGHTLLKNFDIFKEAGGALRPLDKIFKGIEPNAQGKLVFQFVPVRNYAMVNAIEVLDEAPQ